MSRVERIICGGGNCYLVQGENKQAILVDTGMEKYCKRVQKACKGLDVRLIVLTHGHYDHVQNTAYLSEALSAPIAMSEADLLWLGRRHLPRIHGRGAVGKALAFAANRACSIQSIPPFDVPIFLREGDSLTAYGVPARVLALPGHTAGSIGLDIEETHLIVGDALYNTTGMPDVVMYTDWKQAAQSAERIANLGPRTAYFGHGKPALINRVW